MNMIGRINSLQDALGKLTQAFLNPYVLSGIAIYVFYNACLADYFVACQTEYCVSDAKFRVCSVNSIFVDVLQGIYPPGFA